jgi:general secretion pathway protein I
VSNAIGQRGFSLLEVLVALAILGLGLTSILSAQAGLFSSSLRSERVTLASNLARCKLAEVEVNLLRYGYQLTEQKGEGSCCDDETESTYSCTWKVEPVVLPEMNMGLPDGGQSTSGSGPDAGGFLSGFNPTDTTGVASASPLGPLGGMIPGLAGSSSPFGMLSSGSGSGAGMGGLATMALSIVYPTLKPMLEASIRRITVSVKWNEGKSEKTFDIAEYVTNPMQGLPPMTSSSTGLGILGDMASFFGGGAGSAASPSTPMGGR